VSALDAAGRIGYRRRASPLHAARATVVAGYGGALALSALLLENPILLAALLAAVLLAAAAAGVGGQLLGAARASVLPLLAATVLINVLVNRGGLTAWYSGCDCSSSRSPACSSSAPPTPTSCCWPCGASRRTRR
jgi:energy-coupling factor transporter transmembrane protein EcfT